MSTVTIASEYRDLPLESLVESPVNPRRTFEEDALNELASSIRAQGILAPLLVRPLGEQTYEIVAGARRYRAAHLAGLSYVPVRIVDLTDAQALETSIVENLQRRDVHPLEEAQGFAALLRLEERQYSVEQIAAKCAKSPGYVASRLRLTELTPDVTEAFAKDEIGLGHALLLAKLQPQQQEEALPSCFQQQYANGKPKPILLPVRHLREWIERNILLELATAPFSKEDAALLPEGGSCVECPKRTGYNVLLFEGIGTQHDSCSDPKCYAAKVDAHVQKTLAAKPKLVQISTAFGVAKEGSAAIPRNNYVAIREDKPQKGQHDWPEYKMCKYAAEAIITEGSEKGEMRRVCVNPDCPIHHAKKRQKPSQPNRADAKFHAEQEKRRREEALAQATGLRVLKAIGDAVPVRLMKRDLLFVVSRLAAMLDERKVAVLIRQHGMGKSRDGEAPAKLLAAFLPRAEESKLGRILVETVIVLSMRTDSDAAKILREAALGYKVDVEAISAQVKQEFAAKDKAKAAKKPAPKPSAKTHSKPTKSAAA
jgi:ParB family transcriptional regulator, chromosome partitioning protein